MQYPREFVRIMGLEMQNLKRVIGHHFRNRHVNGSGPARSWIAEYHRRDRASGYSDALRQI